MIKQTQTKMFDFSDVGLDFCSGSKNKFPEVFKKMLATGFNEQTASGVAIAGSQITLTYGVNHGYVADRVLQVTAAGGFSKEVYIDEVTANTVICTVIDGETSGLTGVISTKSASLGWNIVYEEGNIHIYKFKHIDETDLFLRVCFQNVAANRNAFNVCVGKTIDLDLGVITDTNALQRTAASTTPSPGSGTWEFGGANTSEYNFTYSQGYANYGKAMVVGSPYHLLFLGHTYYGGSNTTDLDRVLNGVLPVIGHNYSASDYPCIIGFTGTNAFNGYVGTSNLATKSAGWIGDYNVYFHQDSNARTNGFYRNKTNMSSFLPKEIDNFDTTSTALLPVNLYTTGQHVGFLLGMTAALYGASGYPTQRKIDIPKLSLDVNSTTYLVEHSIGWATGGSFEAFAIPLEEIKIGH